MRARRRAWLRSRSRPWGAAGGSPTRRGTSARRRRPALERRRDRAAMPSIARPSERRCVDRRRSSSGTPSPACRGFDHVSASAPSSSLLASAAGRADAGVEGDALGRGLAARCGLSGSEAGADWRARSIGTTPRMVAFPLWRKPAGACRLRRSTPPAEQLLARTGRQTEHVEAGLLPLRKAAMSLPSRGPALVAAGNVVGQVLDFLHENFGMKEVAPPPSHEAARER